MGGRVESRPDRPVTARDCPDLDGLFKNCLFKFLQLVQSLFHNLPWPWALARADGAVSVSQRETEDHHPPQGLLMGW